MSQPSGKQWQIMEILGSSEMTGQEINSCYAEEHGSTMALGTLYVMLSRMKEAGWLLIEEDSDEDGRFRRYRLSGDGLRVMRATISASAQLEGGTIWAC